MSCFYLLYHHYKAVFNLLSLTLLILCSSSRCEAELLLTSTRIIFSSDKTEQTYSIKNRGDLPVMIQAWVDKNEEGGSPDSANSPFIVIPPVFRLEPGTMQNLRIIYNRKKLSTEQETLFWLNLYEIPSKPKNIPDEYSTLTVTVKTQVKFLFRPKKIGRLELALDKLHFSFYSQAGKTYLKLTNPTPFYITMNSLALVAEQSLVLPSQFIAPNTVHHIEIKDFSKLKKGNVVVRFTVINDEGNDLLGTQTLSM